MMGAQTARVQMAFSAKLTMRQGQTMVLTPQLLQAIKLLQMPNVEFSAFIENELASNPLLERAEDQEGREADRLEGGPEAPAAEASAGAWRLGVQFAREQAAPRMEANLGTEVENAFDGERTAPWPRSAPARGSSDRLLGGSRRRRISLGRGARPRGLCKSETISLHDHSRRQAGGHPGRSDGADDRAGR